MRKLLLCISSRNSVNPCYYLNKCLLSNEILIICISCTAQHTKILECPWYLRIRDYSLYISLYAVFSVTVWPCEIFFVSSYLLFIFIWTCKHAGTTQGTPEQRVKYTFHKCNFYYYYCKWEFIILPAVLCWWIRPSGCCSKHITQDHSAIRNILFVMNAAHIFKLFYRFFRRQIKRNYIR